MGLTSSPPLKPAENMSAQNPTPETTIAGHDEQYASESLEKKQDGVAAEHAGDEPQYATGLRLAAIMCTIFLCTLLTALDIVST